MSLGGTFGLLGQLFDHWEEEHWTISHVGLADGVASVEEVRTQVELRAPVYTLIDRESERRSAEASVSIDDNGGLAYTVRTPLVPNDVLPRGTRVDTKDVELTDDGSFVVSLIVSISADADFASGADTFDRGSSDAASESASDERTRSSNGSAVRANRGVIDEHSTTAENEIGTSTDKTVERYRPEVPAYEDTEYLSDVYDAFDTFAEMAAEVDMDVTDETIRRYMIDAGVHEPTQYNTGSGSADSDATPSVVDGESEGSGVHESTTGGSTTSRGEETPVVATDGIGLPEGLSVDEFVEIVRNSRTLYEVQREMGVERTTARELLMEYNLLDFVMGQLALESELYVTRAEVIDRIRESVSA